MAAMPRSSLSTWQSSIARHRRGWLWALAAAVALGLLAWSFTVPWKLNFLRGTIEQRVQAATGRSLVIEGDLWWHWGWRSGWLEANALRFANPAWAGRSDMLTTDRLQAWIALGPLLSRRVDIPEVRVVRPDLWLESQADGRANWRIDTEQGEGESIVSLGRVMLDQGRLHFVQKHAQTDVQVDLQTLVVPGRPSPASDGKGGNRIQATAQGRWHGLDLQGSAQGDDVLKLTAAGEPYGLDVRVRIGSTQVSAAGTVTDLAHPSAADLRVSVSGRSLGEWYRIVGVGLPDSPAYRTSGRVRLADRQWFYENFESRVGGSDLGGSLRFTPAEIHGQRPLIQGSLVSARLDLADLGPVIGLTPTPATSTAPPADAQARPRAAGATGSRAGRILPQQKFSADKWDTLDADVQFEGKAIRNVGAWPIDDLKFHVVLDNRHLRLDPFSMGVAGGDLAGSLSIDGRQTPMPTAMRLDIRRLQLARLVPQVSKSDKVALGSINGRIALDGRGQSFAQILGTASGAVQLAMGRGTVSNLVLEVAGLDLSQSLGLLARGDRSVEVRCALIDTQLESGTLTTRAAVFDTTDTLIQVSGGANLADETLDLTIRPIAKDASLLTLRVPFYVKGTFAKPDFTPDKARLLLRGGSAILLGLINPLAAILPLIETGPGQDSDCGDLMAQARKAGVPVTNRTPAARPSSARPNEGLR